MEVRGRARQRGHSRVKTLFWYGVFRQKPRKERLNPMSKNTVKKANSYRHLTFEEREEIAVALAAGDSKRSIAKLLGRHVSTISRECSRNQRQR